MRVMIERSGKLRRTNEMHGAARAARLLTAVLLCAAPLAASAASPIDGAYGSKEGCIYAKTEESSGADDFLLLTKDDIRTSTAYCEIKSAEKAKDGKINAKVSCQAEGEEQGTEDEAVISPKGKNTYVIDFKDGTHMGPFKKCK